jgi:hypothetical protein
MEEPERVAATRIEVEEKKWGNWGRFSTELWKRGGVQPGCAMGSKGTCPGANGGAGGS